MFRLGGDRRLPSQHAREERYRDLHEKVLIATAAAVLRAILPAQYFNDCPIQPDDLVQIAWMRLLEKEASELGSKRYLARTCNDLNLELKAYIRFIGKEMCRRRMRWNKLRANLESQILANSRAQR